MHLHEETWYRAIAAYFDSVSAAFQIDFVRKFEYTFKTEKL